MTSPEDGDHGSESSDRPGGQPGNSGPGPANGSAQPEQGGPHHVTSALDPQSGPDGTPSAPERTPEQAPSEPPPLEQPPSDTDRTTSFASHPPDQRSADETRDFPAYQPQSYPTYPPSHSTTTTLPTVDAGGPPPSTAAAYPGPGPTVASGGRSDSASTPDGPTATTANGKPARRAGAGLAGALGLIGLSAAAVGAMGLPIQRFPQNQNVYFGTYRDLAGRKLSSNAANQHSISLVGGHIATDWWRFGVYLTLGVLALLFLIKICVPALRRVAGVLLFLGGLGAAAGFLLGAHQTNDYRSVTVLGHIRRISWHHLAYGFWVAVAGCAVVALAGLIAMLQSTRR